MPYAPPGGGRFGEQQRGGSCPDVSLKHRYKTKTRRGEVFLFRINKISSVSNTVTTEILLFHRKRKIKPEKKKRIKNFICELKFAYKK